jgi:hypothetical protein
MAPEDSMAVGRMHWVENLGLLWLPQVGDGAKSEDQPIYGQQLGHASEPAMRCPEQARDCPASHRL